MNRILRNLVLFLGALLFLFPFYYMLISSLQKEPDTTLRGAFPTGGFTLDNYTAINDRVDLLQSLVNSGIFTGGVLLGTVMFGVLAGYALARLHYRGKGTLFAVMLLVQTIPFQLLIIPIYVMIVRTYGLADSYLGMIVPFAINSTAVFIFRQFFLTLPEELFSAARLDGASELLWPFLVTKDAEMQPLAVSLANYISNVAGRAANPYGAILAGAVVLSVPAVALFVAFQRHFTTSDLGSGVKG
jgi:multiple sugar transport system permease protein